MPSRLTVWESDPGEGEQGGPRRPALPCTGRVGATLGGRAAPVGAWADTGRPWEPAQPLASQSLDTGCPRGDTDPEKGDSLASFCVGLTSEDIGWRHAGSRRRLWAARHRIGAIRALTAPVRATSPTRHSAPRLTSSQHRRKRNRGGSAAPLGAARSFSNT